MNAYLVELCHTMDDLALGVFASRAEAIDFGKSVEPEPSTELRQLFSSDCSTPVLVRLVTFKRGRPFLVETIKVFDDDDDDDDSPDFDPTPTPAETVSL